MYELGEAASSLANLLFSALGIFMAHSLYRTPRGRWRAVLTWGLIYLVWTFGAALLSPLLPGVPYVRVSMLVGFTGLFAYLYLFPDIPIQQRIFTYFLVDTSQTLPVLFARVAATLAEQCAHVPGDVVFLAVYLPVTAAFIVLFRWKFKDYILSALRAFRTRLSSLAVFAAVCYITLLLQVDTWGPWPALDFWSAGGALGMIAFVLIGYVLAFRTLTGILAQEASASEAQRQGEQLSLSERYYETLVQRIEQSRIRDHDLRHHMGVLGALCQGEQWDAVSRYVQDMGAELPREAHHQYCQSSAVNALLEHYAGLCAAEGVVFRCRVRLPDLGRVQPLHLCVIFGNALQNALEALRGCPLEEERVLEVRAVAADRRLVLSITNRFSGALATDDKGDPITTKTEPGHGLGLASIRETVRRYGGWCGCQSEGGIFTLNVTFPLDE